MAPTAASNILNHPHLRMIHVEGGTFWMGDDESDDKYEKPAHKVSLSSFYLGQYPVTNEQFVPFLNEVGKQEEGGRTWVDVEGSYLGARCGIMENAGTFECIPGLEQHPMINFLSRYGPYSDQAFWKNGICFSDEKETDCIVRFEEKKRSLFVHTENSQEGYALQREVCQAFVELSKNANAEIALDGEVFASWQEVDKYLHLPDPNPEQQFFAIDGQTPLKLADFARFSEKGMHFELDSRKYKKEKNMSVEEVRNLIARARLDDALNALEEILPDHLKADLIQLQSRLQELERNSRLGILRSEDERLERSRITYSALQLCTDAELPETNAPKPSPSPLPEECKKILFLAANPSDQSRLQTDLEHRILKAELRQGSARDQFEFLPPQFAVTVTELLRAMNDKPNIIHFSGHGLVEGIAITNNNNQTQLMPLPALKRLFRQLNGAAEIVILNACYSAEQAKAISEFGMYVVGNNLPITDPAAISFSKGFYNGLGEGKSFEDAFNDAMIVVLTENPSASEIIEVWKDGQKLNL
jgi:GR25 family glycosyltransferase involved in LPS biosynthesis